MKQAVQGNSSTVLSRCYLSPDDPTWIDFPLNLGFGCPSVCIHVSKQLWSEAVTGRAAHRRMNQLNKHHPTCLSINMFEHHNTDIHRLLTILFMSVRTRGTMHIILTHHISYEDNFEGNWVSISSYISCSLIHDGWDWWLRSNKKRRKNSKTYACIYTSINKGK